MNPHNTTEEVFDDLPAATGSTEEIVRDIKRSLRGVMNGITSRSMRDKGLAYKVNFGVELPRLCRLAEEFPHDYHLAAALWKEDIRECRLLAAMLMPSETFGEDLADLWVEQMRFVEEAECTVMYLFTRQAYASEKAFAWIAREETMFRLCGWLLMGRLFIQGAVPSERDSAELLDHLTTDLRDADAAVARAAGKALTHYMNLGKEEERRAEALLASL